MRQAAEPRQELAASEAAPEPAQPQCRVAGDQPSTDLSAAQVLELQDDAKQTEYRRLYLLQLEQRRGCPGCGD